MEWTQKAYIVGQIIDIIGAGMVFVFSNIPGMPKIPGAFRGNGPTEKQKWNAKWYPRLSLYGFLFILLGFILQFLPSIKMLLCTLLNFKG